MPSVTPDIPIPSSYAPPRQKTARDEPAPDQNDFSTLVDSKTPTSSGDRASTADPASARKGTEKPAAASRSEAVLAVAKPFADDEQPDPPVSTSLVSAPQALLLAIDAATSTSKSKPDSIAGGAPAIEGANSDSAAADAGADTAAAAAAAAVTSAPAPVAGAIVAVIAAPAPASPPADSNQQAAQGVASGPLSIAAAAIATTASTIKAGKPAPTTAVAPAAPAAVTPPATATATAGIETASPTDPQVAAAGEAAVTAVAKPAIKPAVVASTAANPCKPADAPAAVSDATGVSAPSDQVPQAPHVAAATKVADDAASTGKPETATPDTAVAAQATPAPHEHRAVAAPQPASIDAGAPASILAQPQPQPQIQSQLQTTTAQFSVVASATGAVPLNGLAVQIAATAKSGKSSFEIRLDPAELGRIDVRLDVDRQGNVTSHLTVEKPETLAMLRQDAPQLHRALNDAGLKTGDGALQFSLGDQSPSSQNSNGNSPGENGRQPQRLIIREDDALPPALTAGRSYGRALASRSGVDISI